MRRYRSSERFRLRALIASGLVILLFAANLMNLGRVMLIEGDSYKDKARANQLSDTEIAPTRGTIFDANGTVLAKSLAVWKVIVHPNKIPDDDTVRQAVARNVAAALDGVIYENLLELLRSSESSSETVKNQVEFEEKSKLEENLTKTAYYNVQKEDSEGNVTVTKKEFPLSNAVSFDDDIKRYYPQGPLASCVIGFAGADQNGRAGIEYYYNNELTGTPGRTITAKNGRSDLMNEDFGTVYPAENGSSLVLTIDGDVQSYLEKQLWDVYESSSGAGAYGAIMNVNTGGIIAMADIPNYDPNNPYALWGKQKTMLESIEDEEERAAAKSACYYENWRNFNVSDAYEPGSVFKTITACAALEEGVADLSFDYTCIGYIQVVDRVMNCNNHNGHGYQTFREGIMNSCNPFFITLGQRIGSEKLYSYIDAFGFTSRTGVDLPAEFTPKAGNSYYALEDMGKVELSSIAFGQSTIVTPLQMVTALSAMANGGRLLTPYVVDKVLDDEGNIVRETKPVCKRQIISKETSDTITDLLVSVVDEGTGRNAKVAGYSVAGKTGTSQKKNQSGHYVASFGCYAPADDPEIAVIIVVDEPIGQINGGQICTPVAARVVEYTLEKMNVERRYSEKEMANLDTRTPDLVGRKASSAANELREEGFTVEIIGDGDVVISQNPAYNANICKNGVVVLYTEKVEEKKMVEVPDLTGMYVSTAKAEAIYAGVNIKVRGTSAENGDLVSYSQDIEAGTEVEYGSTVEVYFKTDKGVSEIG